jgi:hypothetical protein
MIKAALIQIKVQGLVWTSDELRFKCDLHVPGERPVQAIVAANNF